MPDASPLGKQGHERLFIIVGLTLSPLTKDKAANKEICGGGGCERVVRAFFLSTHNCLKIATSQGGFWETLKWRESHFGTVQLNGS